MSNSGIVHLVGAGPGDTGLFTLRGKEVLGRAEVVIYDGLVNRELLRLAPPTAEIIYGGKHDRTRCVSQAELNALLLSRALEGKRVVRLKGGDPFMFGRGGEEAEVLAAAGLPFEVVPGVSSLYSVPGYAGVPLTHRDRSSSVTVITGHDDPRSPANHVDWPSLAKARGTLVVLMGLKNFPVIATTLIAHGRSPDTSAAVISRGTTTRQQTVVGTLATVAGLADEAGICPPAVIVIGEVAALHERLNWFEQRPLFGRRVAVTQRSDLAQPLVAALREHGAEVLEVPATRWMPHPDRAKLDWALANLESYDWILFANQVGVDFFFERFLQVHRDLRQLGPALLGAYGPRTGRKLREWHLQPAAIAADHKTPLILEAITRCGSVHGKRVLVLRGDVASERVPEALEALGAVVDVVPCYAVQPETDDLTGGAASLAERGADWIIFASGLAIEHLHERLDLPGLVARFPAMRLAIASQTVQWALDKLGLAPSAIAQPDNVEDLVNAIIRAGLESPATQPRSNGILSVSTPDPHRIHTVDTALTSPVEIGVTCCNCKTYASSAPKSAHSLLPSL
ncbi:MAG TPA: uroporphyrinogen-III C-methyltransferase [Candidatus Paceibacterota bacterium]|nr:uroporphyrinogen-III C-methyltransferase [Verrucomicrobiota bacterium]HSA11453.1 uroporphyrinogen-III C-methyltransferase [Candidatus Paceibacterota bacterium]